MNNGVVEMVCTILLLTLVIICSARPPQDFSDSAAQGTSELDLPNRNTLDGRLSDDLQSLKMQLLAQQLSELNNLQPLPAYPDRFILSKRQQRYRQCYFNPISCFRK